MVEYSNPRDFGFRPETVMTALMPYEQYSSKTRRLILGIDMGIASVGVCLIDIRNHEIILMASHIFKAPVEGKHTTWLSLGSSHNQTSKEPKEGCPRYRKEVRFDSG